MTVSSTWDRVLPSWDSADGGTLWVPLDGALRDLIEGHLGEERAAPALPRFAATVMLVRPAPTAGTAHDRRGDVEVFMFRRAASMAFAPGAMAFPGGRLDDRDSEADLPWAGPSPRDWAERLGCSVATARGVLVAAVREAFEESGVLLAGPDATHVVRELDGPDWDEDATRLADHEVSLAEVLTRRRLVLRTDLLGLRSHWLTPEFEPRRYDTYFFAALVPVGQRARARTTEAVAGSWVRPTSILDDAADSQVMLLPPTAYNIGDLARCESAEWFVQENPPVSRLMLAPTFRGDGTAVLSCRHPEALHHDAPAHNNN